MAPRKLEPFLNNIMDISSLSNSIWPNGIKKDTDGYSVYYPLGTNKIAIPDGVNTTWPNGDTIIDNFVFKDGKLVGFVDYKALKINDSKSSVINYDYVDLKLPSITENSMTITPGDNCKHFEISYGYKYNGCKTYSDVINVDENYKENDIINGVWTERLDDLEQGCYRSAGMPYGLFNDCSELLSFEADLPNLTDGGALFKNCTSLYSFTGDISKLKSGDYMFYRCNLNLTSIEHIAESLPNTGGTIDIGSLNVMNNPTTYAVIEKPGDSIDYRETIVGPAIIKMENKGWRVLSNHTAI